MYNQKILQGLKQALRFMVLVGLIGNANLVMAKPKFIGNLTNYCDNPGRTVAPDYAKDFALISGCVGCHDPRNKSKDRTTLFRAYKNGDLSKICPTNNPLPPTSNNAPKLALVGDWNMTLDDMLNIPLKAADPDNDDLIFHLEGTSADFMLTDNSDGTGSITGSSIMAGKYDMMVTVMEIGTEEALSDSEMFTITVRDDIVESPMYMFEKAEAEWNFEKKKLKFDGKIKSIDKRMGKDERCSALEGTIVKISNANGMHLFDTDIHCNGQIKKRLKIEQDLITCKIMVTADSVQPRTITVSGCNADDFEEDVLSEEFGSTMTDETRIKMAIDRVKNELRSNRVEKRRLKRELKRLKKQRKEL